MRFRAAYDARLAEGALRPDPAQEPAVAALSRLEADLTLARPASLFRKADTIRGAYVWGPVGRGKSMLMDLFYDSAAVQPKRRMHFHVFMAEVHALVNIWRNGGVAARQAEFGQSRGDDPIPPVARRLAEQARLLCFDELQVTDIADAMILGRLFTALFALGVTLVATSNRHPDELYRDGLNRQLFVPFIDMLKARLDIVPVSGPHDYRLARLLAAGTWFSPADAENTRAFDALWRDMLGNQEEVGVGLEVLGRTEHWPRATGGLLRAHFASLCVHALGPADYLAISRQFHTVFIEGAPCLKPEMRNEAKRLSTLIDTLYEARAHLVVLADVEPARLYPDGDGAFEFERTVSRMMEMRSETWLSRR